MEEDGIKNLIQLVDNGNEAIRSTPIKNGENLCGTYVNISLIFLVY